MNLAPRGASLCPGPRPAQVSHDSEGYDAVERRRTPVPELVRGYVMVE